MELIQDNQLHTDGLPFIDQTALVSALFAMRSLTMKDDSIGIKELDELTEVNRWAYPVKSTTGVIIVPEHQYDVICEDFEGYLKSFEARKRSAGSYHPPKEQVEDANKEIEKVNKIKELYESAESFKRHVFSWWVVPYWLGDKLIDKGEVVLRGYGCTWWGITDRSIKYPTMSEAFKQISSELLSMEGEPLSHERYSQYRLYFFNNDRIKKIITGIGYR